MGQAIGITRTEHTAAELRQLAAKGDNGQEQAKMADVKYATSASEPYTSRALLRQR